MTAVSQFVAKRRWFAAKDEAAPQLALSSFAPVEPGQFAFAELRATTSRADELYLLPLTFTDVDSTADSEAATIAQEPGNGGSARALVDATYTLAFVQTSIAFFRDAAILRTAEDGEIRYLSATHVDEWKAHAFDGRQQPLVKWLSAEQSNTSIVIDERLVLKLIRRILPGVHPEAEMGRYLALRGYKNSCGLLGEVVWQQRDGKPRTICIVQRFIPNEGDAWKYANELLIQVAQSVPPADAHGATEPSGLEDRHAAKYCAFAQLVGKRLAELHLALATETADPAFCPEPATPNTVSGWMDSATTQVIKALDVLERKSTTDASDDPLARSIIGQRQQLLEAIAESVPLSLQALCTRIHGDFHLGQILKTQDDIFIIDFEGEPAKPLEERRAKNSPIRDVAGLIRSLSYASSSVLRSSAAANCDRKQLAALMDSCRSDAERAFLSGYQGVIAATSSPLKMDDATFNALLNLFLLDKAAYEICYEAAHRPEWIDVPLGAFAAIVRERFTK